MKIHLITGGSGSGKSAWGESWIAGEAKGRPLPASLKILVKMRL